MILVQKSNTIQLKKGVIQKEEIENMKDLILILKFDKTNIFES